MPSVRVSWRGRVADEATLAAFVPLIGWIAEAHAGHWKRRGDPLVRPDLSLLDRWQDETLGGRILLSQNLVDEAAFHEGVARAGLETVRTARGEVLAVVDRLRVTGVQFRIYDPGGYGPVSDRAGFMVLHTPDLPLFDGLIATVWSREYSRHFHDPLIAGVDWHADAPTVHLRYHLEEWFDELLAWVRYFFVPDLEYWRYGERPGWPHYAALFDRLVAADGAETTRRHYVHALVESLDHEIRRNYGGDKEISAPKPSDSDHDE